ncbi:hypothetical protein JHK85_012781 [Glycine max]|nr:hypothetical protein JHK85_012781 [Glycine max]
MCDRWVSKGTPPSCENCCRTAIPLNVVAGAPFMGYSTYFFAILDGSKGPCTVLPVFPPLFAGLDLLINSSLSARSLRIVMPNQIQDKKSQTRWVIDPPLDITIPSKHTPWPDAPPQLPINEKELIATQERTTKHSTKTKISRSRCSRSKRKHDTKVIDKGGFLISKVRGAMPMNEKKGMGRNCNSTREIDRSQKHRVTTKDKMIQLQSLLFSGSMEVSKWNYALRSLRQHAKNNIISYSQARKLSSASSVAVSNRILNKRKEM